LSDFLANKQPLINDDGPGDAGIQHQESIKSEI